jgi:hypothetical protein
MVIIDELDIRIKKCTNKIENCEWDSRKWIEIC